MTPITAAGAWRKTGTGQYHLVDASGQKTGAWIEYSGGKWHAMHGQRRVGAFDDIARAKGLARTYL